MRNNKLQTLENYLRHTLCFRKINQLVDCWQSKQYKNKYLKGLHIIIDLSVNKIEVWCIESQNGNDEMIIHCKYSNKKLLELIKWCNETNNFK